MADRLVLLNDEAVQRFIREGYVVLQPGFPDGFDRMVFEKLERVFEEGKNPRNNLLPRVPELQEVWEHPVVGGALASLLGPDYYLHMHRHVHESYPGTTDQRMHKDSLYNSRYAVDNNRRHHHTRWIMGFYYPQDTPVELGPTAIIPKSQYLNVDRPDEEEVFTSGPAGTVVLVHYDLLHRRARNDSERTRHMAKFLFTRMTEPAEPSWDHRDAEWTPSGDPQEPIWRYMWNWHLGERQAAASGVSVSELAERLRGDSEAVALDAAYTLGRMGADAVPVLVAALKEDSEAAPRNAAYGFNGIGAAAVPALLEAAGDADARVRARAVDVLGDMGPSARTAIPGLVRALEDGEEDVRSRAAEALGTVGQGRGDLAGPLGGALVEDASEMVRRNAALSLSRLGPCAGDAVAALARALRDESHYVRGFAVKALERIGTAEAFREALKYLQTMRWDHDERMPARQAPVPGKKD